MDADGHQHSVHRLSEAGKPNSDLAQRAGARIPGGAVPDSGPDPYAVLSEGRLYWIQDAYTTSDRYPYSNPRVCGFRRGDELHPQFRQSVVDMYDGTVSFYVMDPHDPVLQVYNRAFPGVFKNLDTLSPDLKLHLRYPQDLSRFRRRISDLPYDRSAGVLQPGGSLGAPQEKYDGEVRPMEPYYILMKLPGSHQLEYLMMTSFYAAEQGQHDCLAGGAIGFPRLREDAVLRAAER